jgi:hypothetical protein
MADVKLPLVGPVSKKWVVIVAVGSAATIGYVIIRRRSQANSAAATAASGASSTDTSDIDPLTGDIAGSAQDQADLAAMQAGGYEGDDLGDGLGDYGGYLAATPAAATIPGAGGFTTNGEWAQQAETDLGGLGIDQTTLAAALGYYLTGQALSDAQQSLVDQAIAEEGYPPVAGPDGYPPAMKTGATGTGTGTGGGGTGTGGGGGSNVTVPKVEGMRVDDANAALTKAGLTSHLSTARKPGVAYWVASQTPGAGKSVAAGSAVDLGITTRKP